MPRCRISTIFLQEVSIRQRKIDLDHSFRLFSTEPSIIINGRTYRILNLIGQGGEGIVFRCKDAKGFQYAVKIFVFTHCPSSQKRARIRNFKKEAKILKYLSGRSRHFIHLYDYEYKPKEEIGYLLMELGDDSLRKRLKGIPLNDPLRKHYWRQIVEILIDLENAQIGIFLYFK